VRTDFTSAPPPPPIPQAVIVPKARHGGVIAILVILGIFIVAGAGVAYFIYRRFTAVTTAITATNTTGTAATSTQQTASITPPSASVDVVTTEPMTITETTTSGSADTNLSTTTATQAQIIPPLTMPGSRETQQPPNVTEKPRPADPVRPRETPEDDEPRVSTPPPPVPSNVRAYIDGDSGDADVNDEIMSGLHRQLNGVNRVVIRGSGEQHEKLVERFKNALPSIAVVDNADTVIDFNGTLDRVNRGKKRRQARATIRKNGRVIFEYELPPEEFRVGDDPAEAFSRVLSEAFGHSPGG
jgi:hypothetical protein